jgi:hypothetical protein
MAWPVIGAVLGIGATIAGSVAQNNATGQQRADNDRLLDQQLAQDQKVYEFNWDESLRDYQYLLDQTQIRRAEEETIGRLKDQMSLDQYKSNLAIRDYDYFNQLRQFDESNRIYGYQKGFNQIAAEQAAESEKAKLRETVMATAFENQDMMIELMQQEGMAQARGVSGNSVNRQLQASMAQFGRNQAVLAESLLSAESQASKNIRKIAADKFGADAAAEANKMLVPIKGPDPTIPYRTPRATFQDPRAPVKGPAPVRGVNTAARPSGLGILTSGLSGIASTINTGLDQGWIK